MILMASSRSEATLQSTVRHKLNYPLNAGLERFEIVLLSEAVHGCMQSQYANSGLLVGV